MKRQLNPFVVGAPVSDTHFIGRENIINNCYNRLAGPVRTSIAISGEHGIGKTSLLHHLMHIARLEQWGQPYTHNVFVYLDCQTVEQFTPTRFWRRTLELLKQAKDDPDLRQQIDVLLEQPELDATHLQRLLRWLDQHKTSLVLLLDSFTGIVRTNSNDLTIVSDFLAGLRALTNLPGYALTLLTATREPLNILCANIVKNYPGSYFYNNFAFESLGPFIPDEIDALLKQALAQVDFEFNRADRDLLYHLAGAHPALLQMAGYHLFEMRRQGPLTDQNRKKVIEDFERAARHYFSSFWEDSSPRERTLFILTIILPLSEQSSFQANITTEEIRALLQRYERDLARLAEWGLIQHTENTYKIFSTIFTWWIVREVTAETESQLADRHKTIGDEALRRAWQTLKKLSPNLTLDRLTQTLIERPSQPAMEKPPEPLSPLPDSPDVLLPRYKLQKVVGRGASGVVYKAFDSRLHRTVAIKLLHNLLATPMIESHYQLLKEARAASQLQHPHIVTIYDVIEEDNQICLVMEYLEGQTLTNLLKEDQRLPLKQVIGLVEQAANALDYAHEQGVIHRDIKPANLMITAGKLKLTDFGIAKIVDASQSKTNPSSGLKGTVIYMSPEQVNEQPLDGRSDLFSLATVTFEMLSGALPWPGKAYVELMNNITGDSSLSLADFDVSTADILDPVFQKALSKEPTRRYQRGQDFVQALKAAVAK